jgi:hypothetical protein
MRHHNRFMFSNRSHERRVFFTEPRFLRFASCRGSDNLPNIIFSKPNGLTQVMPVDTQNIARASADEAEGASA